MKLKLVSVNADPSLTSLQSTIVASYDDLCEIFGRPFEYNGDKVTTEWDLRINEIDEDGEVWDSYVCTIYDWKQDTPPRGVYEWHIGGHSKKSAHVLKEYIKQEK